MFRSVLCNRIAVPATIFSLSASGYAKADLKADKMDGPFDSKGLPAKLVWYPNQTSLSLVGVGMRRKNLYVTMVDVYKVGAYLSPPYVGKAQVWKDAGKPSSFSDLIVPNPSAPKGKSGAAKACITLKFVRDVGNDAICAAFKEAFEGCNPDAVKRFQEALNATIAATGLKTGEEISFIWMENDEVVMTKNGINGKSVDDIELANRLLDVYFDPKKSVSPDLIVSVDANVGLVKA
jgi:hypothetical protein